MDQIKIGKFIASCRKKQKLTQEQLAEKLNVSDRAISKWENGVCLPDIGNMLELCKIFDIAINDLFSGELVNMTDNEKKLEDNLIELVKIKEQKDKELLTLEIVIGVLSIIILLSMTFVASFLEMATSLRILLVVGGFVPAMIGVLFALRIEQIAGYYECNKCHHKYIPTYNSVLFAMHINRTRYMKCPKCEKKSWNKKVLK